MGGTATAAQGKRAREARARLARLTLAWLGVSAAVIVQMVFSADTFRHEPGGFRAQVPALIFPLLALYAGLVGLPAVVYVGTIKTLAGSLVTGVLLLLNSMVWIVGISLAARSSDDGLAGLALLGLPIVALAVIGAGRLSRLCSRKGNDLTTPCATFRLSKSAARIEV